MYNDILNLLENGYFVPMWKSDDDCIQPTIGKPFSPKSSTILPTIQVIIISIQIISCSLIIIVVYLNKIDYTILFIYVG